MPIEVVPVEFLSDWEGEENTTVIQPTRVPTVDVLDNSRINLPCEAFTTPADNQEKKLNMGDAEMVTIGSVKSNGGAIMMPGATDDSKNAPAAASVAGKGGADEDGAPEYLRKRSFANDGNTGGAPPQGPMAQAAARRRSSIATAKHRQASTATGVILASDLEPKWKTAIIKLIDGTIFSSFMAVVTVWALFGDDIRLVGTYKDADPHFVGLTIFCLVCFTVELVLASLAKPGYLLGFHFWLDFVATVSLLMDIPEIMEVIGLQSCDGDSSGENALEGDNNSGGSDTTDGVTLARAGRASRAGTKAGRIVRVVRLIRIVKLYKAYQQKKEEADFKNRVKLDEEEESLAESRVGQRLSDLTTRRVIIMVLAMLFIIPLFDVEFWPAGTEVTLKEGGISLVDATLMSGGATDGFYAAIEAYYTETKGMYRLAVNGTFYEGPATHPPQTFTLDGKKHRALRCDEFEVVQEGTSFAYFDIRFLSELQAVLNMCRTIFICIVLSVGALMFSKDANELVLNPIERMVKKVQEISENPLKKLDVVADTGPAGEQMETRMLENSIAKICGLLQVGFGDAGSEVIAENMKAGGDINPMVPGKKMVAIFGFCDIRQFTDTTEVLQEGIMEFVNTIGKIVHMEVHWHGGSANKNIGDAFLLVWKFPSEVTLEDVENVNLKGPKRDVIASVADKALASFVIIMAGLRRSAKLSTYRGNAALNRRMPNFEVKMGFGLHVGWAIEGAIGSEWKVDASYLSPNVNMSSRLEAATKQFGVPLLISEDFVNILSTHVRRGCRQIDRVTVKGSVQPMGIFTYDADPEEIPFPPPNADPKTPAEKESNSFRDFTDEFTEHPDIVKMRAMVSADFLAHFAEGFNLYREGRWEEAREILQASAVSRKNSKGEPMKDGPSLSLLGVMEGHNFRAPPGWAGYRELTDK